MKICKCGAPIRFVLSKNGKFFPCDDRLIEYKADPDGEDWIVDEKSGELIRCTFEFECRPTGLGRIPHWATCPYGNDFRKK